MNLPALIVGLAVLVVLAAVVGFLLDVSIVRFRVWRARRSLARLRWEPAGTCRHCGRTIGSLVTAKGGRLRWFTEDRESLCAAHFPGRETSFGHELEAV